MKETSWRTLMLLTTLLAVFVIFQGTVRSPRLPAVQARPARAVRPREDPNRLQNKVACRPDVVEIIDQAPPVWLDDTPEDPNEPDESPPPVPE
jgi:hypothetical protein